MRQEVYVVKHAYAEDPEREKVVATVEFWAASLVEAILAKGVGRGAGSEVGRQGGYGAGQLPVTAEPVC